LLDYQNTQARHSELPTPNQLGASQSTLTLPKMKLVRAKSNF